MTLVQTPTTGTQVQHVLRQRGTMQSAWAFDALLIVFGSLFVALCAQIRIPLPFTPVPITAQTMGILLVGSLLGARHGTLSMLLYLALGAIGLPFFSGGNGGIQWLQGATAGYLLAAPLAAALVGWLAQRGWDRHIASAALSMLLGNVIIYALGVAWLATLVGISAAIQQGLLPFIIGDVLKIAVACLVLPGGWHLIKRTTDEGSAN
jgi:biotin transport system substrate-specific component